MSPRRITGGPSPSTPIGGLPGRNDRSTAGLRSVGGPDGSLWARDARGQDLRLFDARDPESSCAGALCAFAPDGKRVVAGTLGLREGRRVFTTWQMNIDGTARVRLPLGESDMVADWSPDGEQLLVVSEGRGPYGPQHIDRLSLATPDAKRTRLLMEGRMFIHPRFSPEGGRIAYVGYAPGDVRHGLIIIDVDGSNPRRVMDLGGMAAGLICWSPDGMRLAVSRLTSPGEVSGSQVSLVEVVGADGTDRRTLDLPIAFTEISELNWR
jgi:dipeptidyl aminopeptidase/acylaminoacyl peptidase